MTLADDTAAAPRVMVDHLTLPVADFEASRRFYLSALAPLGFGVVDEGNDEATFGAKDAYDVFSISRSETPSSDVHIAFSGASRETVDAFHAAALGAGGRDNGAPGLRPQYRADYYAAFALDPDGNNVEAVHFG